LDILAQKKEEIEKYMYNKRLKRKMLKALGIEEPKKSE